MADLLILIAAPATAWLITYRWSRSLPPHAPLRQRNYRGIDVPTACGIVVIAGMLAAFGLVAFLGVVLDSALVDRAAVAAAPFAAVAAGFGLLGLWDDLAGGEQERGWRAHLRSLRRGAPSSGAVKLVAGGVFAFVLTASERDGLLAAIVAAGVLAGSANLFNLLDLRPGRALKFWLALTMPLSLGLAIIGHTGTAVCILIAAGAVVAFLPHDLGERAMLGDTGANAVGAITGAGVIAVGETTVSLIVLIVLIGLHAIADRPGLSQVIDAVRPLRSFDRAGRAQP